jgi:hypothetical protein
MSIMFGLDLDSGCTSARCMTRLYSMLLHEHCWMHLARSVSFVSQSMTSILNEP